MKISRRQFLMVAGAAAAAGALAGCGASSTSTAGSTATSTAGSTAASAAGDAPIEQHSISILAQWTEDSTEGMLLTAMANQYKAEHEGFDYEYEYCDSNNIPTKLSTLAASDDLPELFAIDPGVTLADYVNAGKLLNVTQALTDLGCMDAIDAGAQAILKNLSGFDELYDLPFGLNIEGMWYNKVLFDQAGIATPPTTWAEMTAACDALLAAGIQPIAVGAGDAWPATRWLNAYAMRLMGPDAMQQIEDGTVAYNGAELVQTAQALQDMNKAGYFGEGCTTVSNDTAQKMIMNGQAAFLYTGSWYVDSLNSADNLAGPDGVGFFNIPTVDGGKGTLTEYAMNCGTALGLSASKYDACVADFLKYFVTNLGDYAISEMGSLKGYTINNYPSDLSGYTKLLEEEMAKVTASGTWFEAYMESELSAMAQQEVSSLLNGDLTAQAYCDELQDCYESVHQA